MSSQTAVGSHGGSPSTTGIVITAIVTFIVTAAAGVCTYWLTVGLQSGADAGGEERRPLVVYSDRKEGNVEISDGVISFLSFDLINIGQAKAAAVSVKIEAPKGAKILDYKIKPQDDVFADIDEQLGDDASSLMISIAGMIARESLSISVTAKGEGGEFGLAGRTSDAFISDRRPPIADSGDSREPLPAVLAAAVAGSAAAIMTVGWSRRFSLGSLRQHAGSFNNAGFALLHAGDVDAAKQVFSAGIANEGASAYELANLAGCYAVENNVEKAEVYLAAARLFMLPESDAVMLINGALIALVSGRRDEGGVMLQKAKAQGRSPKVWVEQSVVLRALLAEASVAELQ